LGIPLNFHVSLLAGGVHCHAGRILLPPCCSGGKHLPCVYIYSHLCLRIKQHTRVISGRIPLSLHVVSMAAKKDAHRRFSVDFSRSCVSCGFVLSRYSRALFSFFRFNFLGMYLPAPHPVGNIPLTNFVVFTRCYSNVLPPVVRLSD